GGGGGPAVGGGGERGSAAVVGGGGGGAGGRAPGGRGAATGTARQGNGADGLGVVGQHGDVPGRRPAGGAGDRCRDADLRQVPGGDRGGGDGHRGGGYRRQVVDEALPAPVAVGVEPADGAVAEERAGHVVDGRRPARVQVAGDLLGGVEAAEVTGADDVVLRGDPGLLVPGRVGVRAAGDAAGDPGTGHRPGLCVRVVADPE